MKILALPVPIGSNTLSSLVLTKEVMETANFYYVRKGKSPVFKIVLVGDKSDQSLRLGNFSISCEADLDDPWQVDVVIVPSLGEQIEDCLKQNKKLIDWICQQYKEGAEVASLCTGAFMLAAAGLLDNKPCSTHWASADIFQKLFPGVNLTIEKIITEQNGVYTTGGAISSMNLVLHMIEKYYDRETAIYCAKVFEVDLDRTSQSAFIIFSGQKNHNDSTIRKAQQFMEKNVGEKMLIEELAEKLSVDRRNFDRRFKKATGNTPLEYLQRLKMEAAKRSFETTRKDIHEVMYEVGYTDSRSFRKVFRKITGLSPMQYRMKYNKDASKQ